MFFKVKGKLFLITCHNLPVRISYLNGEFPVPKVYILYLTPHENLKETFGNIKLKQKLQLQSYKLLI